MLRSLVRSLLVPAVVGFAWIAADPDAARATDIITTLAGGGSLEGYFPDEANLELGTSQGLAISAAGEVFVSDSNHHQVLKINPASGLITLVAGNGARAYSGDGSPAASASLNAPAGLAFDSTGSLLIVDRGNFVVRRVDVTTGIISTVAGTGLFTGQVVGANPAALIGEGGPAIAATFGNIGDLAVDAAGAIYLCDTGNQIVRKFTIGGTITTIAGTLSTAGFAGDGVANGALTTVQFSGPTGIAVDAAGSVYIADSGNRRVRKLTLDGTVNTVVGNGATVNDGYTGDGGLAIAASIGTVGGMAFDATGKLLVTCVGAAGIRKVDVAAATPTIVTIAGNGNGANGTNPNNGTGDVIGDRGPATGAMLLGPRDVAVDSLGNILILDVTHQRIRFVDQATGFIDTLAGSGLSGFIGDRGSKQGGVLTNPAGAAFDLAGNLYVADTANHAVRKIALDGKITTFAGNGFAGSGTITGLGNGGPAALASLSSPRDVLVFGNTLFIADSGNNAIRAVDLSTGLIRSYVTVSAPQAIIADAIGRIYVAHGNLVDLVDVSGVLASFAGNAPVDTVPNPLGDGLSAASATLSAPSGLALNVAGELLIADTGNNRIRKIGPAPGLVVSTVAGGGAPVAPLIGDGGPALSASLNAPGGVAVDATRILIADTGNHRIRAVVLGTGTIETICGTGVAGLTGDGDLSATASVNAPGRIFFKGPNLVIADAGNNRIRQIVPALDLDLKTLSLSTKLNFALDRRTGQITRGRDTVSVKAALALPGGISAVNLPIQVDIVELHQQTQFDALGKPPRITKPAVGVVSPLGFVQPAPPLAVASKFTLGLRGTSVLGGKPTAFSYSGTGTLREEFGRIGYTNLNTPTTGITIPVRVNVTLGSTTFTGLASTTYKATQGKGGSAVTIRPR